MHSTNSPILIAALILAALAVWSIVAFTVKVVFG